MTVGIGFKCSNGIVLFADTQMTWEGSHKYYECKLYRHQAPGWAVMFTFSGNPNVMKSFDGKFRDAMSLSKGPYTVAMVRDAVETVLSFFDVLKDSPTQLSLLCAISVPSEGFGLFKTDAYTIHEVFGCDYVGLGDSSLLSYLSQLLTQPGPDGYITRQAVMLAIYLVMKAKTHVDGCGGDTDTLILRPSGAIEPIGPSEIYRVEQMMLKIENRIRRTAEEFFDKTVLDDEFAATLESLTKLLTEDHFQFRIPID